MDMTSKAEMNEGKVNYARNSHRNCRRGILDHIDLSTTQGYLGEVKKSEANRWTEKLYG